MNGRSQIESNMEERVRGISVPLNLDAFPFHFLAGSAVLHAYYGEEEWQPNDVDVFVPAQKEPDRIFLSNVFCSNREKLGIGEGYSFSCEGDYIGGDFFSVKIHPPNQMTINVVFLYFNEMPTKEEFYKAMVDRFDIKICALAWDGDRLWQPPMANLEKRWSLVKYDPRKGWDRIWKYLSRGFHLEDENGEIYKQSLTLGQNIVNRT